MNEAAADGERDLRKTGIKNSMRFQSLKNKQKYKGN